MEEERNKNFKEERKKNVEEERKKMWTKCIQGRTLEFVQLGFHFFLSGGLFPIIAPPPLCTPLAVLYLVVVYIVCVYTVQLVQNLP